MVRNVARVVPSDSARAGAIARRQKAIDKQSEHAATEDNLTARKNYMEPKVGKKAGEFISAECGSGPRLRWTGKKAMMFWKSFIKLNDIPKRGFIKELKRDGNPSRALERLFAKTNRRAAMRQKKLSAGKGHRTR